MLSEQNIMLAIGDGWNDCLMMQNADISIELALQDSKNKVNAGDIVIHKD